MDAALDIIMTAARWALPALALWLLLRCVRSMLSERYEPEIWAYLEGADGTRAALKHWECIVGRSRSCDVVLNRPEVARVHAAIERTDRGGWRLRDLSGTGETGNGALRDEGAGLSVADGDTLFFASGQIGRRAVQQPSQTQKRYHVFERYPGRAPEPPPEQHIRAHGQMREQPDVLKNISEPPPFGREAYAPFRIEPDCLTAGDPPCIRAKQPGKALQ